MRVGVVRTQVPFVTGGAERHSANLCQALERSGHEAVEITLPFKWYPGTALANSVLAAKLTDLSEFEGVPIDLMIGLKFPAYLAQHPNRKFWIIHQHRQAYDHWDAGTSDLLHDPDGLALRHLVQQEDKALFAASKDPIYANSKNVAGRLKKYLGVKARSLYHPPPGAELLRCDSYSDYLFAPGRLNRSKRLELTLQALAATRPPLKLVIAGTAENPAYLRELQQLTEHLGIRDRVEWLGAVSDDTMRHHYSNARAVVFVPQDEDYGYIALEAMLSAKATLTVTDAGGPLEFIRNGKEGLICAPDPRALAAAFEQVMQDKDLAERLGQTALRSYQRMNISWDHVVETLTGVSAVVAAPAPAEAPLKITSVTPAPSDNKPACAAAQLKAAVAPPVHTVALPFETVTDVLTAYEFDTLAAVKGLDTAHLDIGLANYLGTHWQRYLTTLELVDKIKPTRVLDIGVFPPLVFEALLANAVPGVKLAGVWEGPEPYYQHVKSRNGTLPEFETELLPANIERDRLPFEDGSFDLVLGMEIFEHLALDPNFFLREAARVLAPGGHILLTTPNVASHRGVTKTLEGNAPYSFGIFVPTGGVYGRHNREYTAREVECLAQSAGFDTDHLRTIDVYSDHINPQTAELLLSRDDDLTLRGETIFYVGKKTREPGAAPERFYHGNPIKMSGEISVLSTEAQTGLTRISVTNQSPLWWTVTGEHAMCVLAEWSNSAGYLVHTNFYLPLDTAIAPDTSACLKLRLDKTPAETAQGRLSLNIFQAGVGSIAGTGRANKLSLPCSEDAFHRLVRGTHDAN